MNCTMPCALDSNPFPPNAEFPNLTLQKQNNLEHSSSIE